MSGYVVNQRLRPLTGSRYEITSISARDSNEISTATPTCYEVQQLSGTSPITAQCKQRKSEIQYGRR